MARNSPLSPSRRRKNNSPALQRQRCSANAPHLSWLFRMTTMQICLAATCRAQHRNKNVKIVNRRQPAPRAAKLRPASPIATRSGKACFRPATPSNSRSSTPSQCSTASSTRASPAPLLIMREAPPSSPRLKTAVYQSEET
jgi:hypothetical protein